MIEIWHLDITKMSREDAFDFMSGTTTDFTAALSFVERVQAAWKTKDIYIKVAEVEGHNLDEAYMLTNNIDTSWSMEPDPKVKVIAPLHVVDGKTYGLKSSSIGDVFVLFWGNGDRFTHVVSNFGFQLLEGVD